MDALARNVKDFGVEVCDQGSEKQGIVHMIGPETGRIQPGKFIVCGDSHTATNGAFGAIAFGIGTSEIEHVFATQTIWQKKPKRLKVEFIGKPAKGVFAKDYFLALIAKYGIDAGISYATEYTGPAIADHLQYVGWIWKQDWLDESRPKDIWLCQGKREGT